MVDHFRYGAVLFGCNDGLGCVGYSGATPDFLGAVPSLFETNLQTRGGKSQIPKVVAAEPEKA